MQRRKFIATAVGSCGIVLAGCSGDTDGGNGNGNGGQNDQNQDGGAEGEDGGGDNQDGGQSNTHDMGETFTVGEGDQAVEYTVNDASGAEAIGSSGLGAEADGVYVVLILEMTNVGDESFDITSNHLKLVDSQEREFETSTEASLYLDQDPRFDVEGITFDTLQPGLTVERGVVFDVSPGESYAFKAEPAGYLSNAEEHFVPLGTVEEPDNS